MIIGGPHPANHPVRTRRSRHASHEAVTISVDRVERLLRRLALSDERSLRLALADPGTVAPGDLDAKTQALIRLASLLSVGAATVSLRWTVDVAYAAGATDDEILGVLLAIAPAVGHARVVGVAPSLGRALGYDFDLDEVEERH
jgi:4-carboxymuconolactone decarboxylase